MENNQESWQLNQIDGEEIAELIMVLRKSLGLEFKADAFLHASTFGDLCDVFERHISYEDKAGCTSQQAFYKLRKAILETSEVAKEDITASTPMELLFPRKNRRRQVRLMLQQMGLGVKLLTCKSWIKDIAVGGMLLSFIVLFFNFKRGGVGITFFLAGLLLAEKWGKEFDQEITTIGKLVELLVSEHYIKVRRYPNTVNRAEIVPLITKVFQQKLSMDSANLTGDTSLI
ncbi:hypothetical protein HNQ91_001736 [Filimonas zeae]|uniref:Uncharacterized protein n=1 Tax=Filimonas zeae TaxID=1737353 RepID=A0A917MVY2_9BACT|nr:hypothetical protein [Filimonas zeae]MDR6338685.1 hypothetical protein [Filimonas zeae]GGH67063.1 hypothetical protein GCM10011379_21920 [Filimonas zeae]